MVTTTRYLTFVAVLAASLTLTAPAGAKPGDLDPTFAGSGATTLPVSVRSFGDVTALQPDGKLIVAGLEHTVPYPSCVVARYLTDGTLDTTFGPGTAGLYELSGNDVCRFTSIKLRPDGKILLGGTLDPPGPQDALSLIVGLTSEGELDNGWAGDGIFTSDYRTGNESVFDISLVPNGTLLAISSPSIGGSGVATALKTNGTLETSVWPSGQSGVGGGFMKQIHGLADGRFLVAGKLTSPEEAFRLSRLVADGTVFDVTFGESGHATSALPGGDSGLEVMVVQPDGKYLLAGSGYAGGEYRGVLLRYTAEGQPDPTFGVGGAVTFGPHAEDYFRNVAVAPDGKIIAVGESVFPPIGSDAHPIAVRFNSDGSLDSGFGSGGIAYDFFGPIEATAWAVAVGGDGKVSVLGTTIDGASFSRMAVARLIGAADPLVTPLSATISSPGKKKLKAKKFKKFSGTAAGDGLSRVQISVLKSDSKLLKKKKRCLQLSSNKAKLKKYKAVKKKCVPAKWLNATGTTSWSYKLKKALKPGKYTLYVRSLNAIGAPQATPTKKSFTLTK